MAKSRTIGDQHVEAVFYELQQVLYHKTRPTGPSEISRKTADYLINKFPNIKDVSCKLYQETPDKHNDLTIEANGKKYPINLFFIQGRGNIQPKNLGAKSFLSKYFLSEESQKLFNEYFEKQYKKYLVNLLELKGMLYYSQQNIRDLKAKVRLLYNQFDEESNPCRDRFLSNLRDFCYNLLQRNYNTNQSGFHNAFSSLLLVNETNIITRVHKGSITVEEFNPVIPDYHDIIVFKKGRNTIGIQCGNVALTLRFKFENKPDSSVKLATSFETYDLASDFAEQVISANKKTIRKLDELIDSTTFSPAENTSNAVGKCHEAFSYYWIIKNNPTIIQVDEGDSKNYFSSYLSKLNENTARAIQESSRKTADTIINYIRDRKGTNVVESIQLVAGIYTTDRLNTGDIAITIRHSNGEVEELFISLKAIKKIGQKITTKNPGIGTILGNTYFNLREDMNEKVAEVKSQYFAGFGRQYCLEILSQEIGQSLEKAPQSNLKRGVENLLGKALMIVTAYEQNRAFFIEHSNINGNISVLRNTPSKIQNTLTWNNGEEEISLRVKFSSGQTHGWSPIKLTSEYTYKSTL